MKMMGYECPCPIGVGGFSTVYRVTRSVTGEYVACKVSSNIPMLQEEWALLSSLEHPLFPKAYEWREEGGYGFLFLEYIADGNLEQYIRQKGKLSAKQTIKLGKALAEGLCYLHELDDSIIFRDLKPENIMLGEDGTVKLLDFGSAARLQNGVTNIAGTQGYGAPEQWQFPEKIGTHSDVYALGKVLRFAGRNTLGTGWFGTLLEDCTREQIEERIPNMRCFLGRLKQKGRNLRGKQEDFLYQQSVLRF